MLPHRNTARKPGDGEQGLSEVIGFVLILGLIVIFIALWMTYVVPAEGRENEIQHMNDVRDWFTQYKITLDSLWINSMNTAFPNTTFPAISNSFTLGSQGGATQAGGFYLPLMKPIGSTGGLAVVNYGETIQIQMFNGGDQVYYEPFNLGVLEFQAANNYWIPQTYYYQMGGVFLQQEGGVVARVAPLVSLSNMTSSEAPNEIRVSVAPAGIIGGGLVNISGQGPARVDTYLDTASYPASYSGTHVNITLSLSNPARARAWENVLREMQYSRGMPKPSDNPIRNCSVSRSGSVVTMYVRASPVRLTVFPANYSVSLQSIATGAT